MLFRCGEAIRQHPKSPVSAVEPEPGFGETVLVWGRRAGARGDGGDAGRPYCASRGGLERRPVMHRSAPACGSAMAAGAMIPQAWSVTRP
jgi:hypothetical protein